MDKCRICLGNKKSLISIFECLRKVSFADMMGSVANIKVVQHDGITNKICRHCRKTLVDAYNFKLLIERSDAVLHGNIRKINFSNINDIKVEIEVDTCNEKSLKKYADIEGIFEHGDEAYYSNTFIKKIENNTKNVCLKPIPVLEFLKTIKDAPDSDHYSNYSQDYDVDCSGVDSDCDGDYIPPYQLLDRVDKRARKRNKTRSEVNKVADDEPGNNDEGFKEGWKRQKDYEFDDDYIPLKLLVGTKKKIRQRKKIIRTTNEVCIKPVFIKDLKLVYSKPKRGPERNKNPDKLKVEKKLVCPICGILKFNLKKHILVHTEEKKFKCDVCDNAYRDQKSVQKHKIISHAKIKNFKCDECVAAFSTKGSLKSHKIMHNPEMKYVCDICDKSFKRKTALLRHRKMHNVANKTVICDLCNMSFFTKHALRHHLRIHTRERPYNCELCSQPYSYKRDFNRHCLKKHGVFLNRRQVYVMNEEVLAKEQILMRDLILKVQGSSKNDDSINPFGGRAGALAFTEVVKALEAKKIPIAF